MEFYLLACLGRHTYDKQITGSVPFIAVLLTSEGIKMGDIENTLAERESRYGSFKDHARITQNIKRAMVDSNNWGALPDDMKESLEMTAHKIGRILNGGPMYKDSWHDIIGYTKLVEDELKD